MKRKKFINNRKKNIIVLTPNIDLPKKKKFKTMLSPIDTRAPPEANALHKACGSEHV